MTYPTFLILLAISSAAATNPCCTIGENRLVKKKCADGSPMAALSCPYKYITNREEGIDIDENGNLIIASSTIPTDRFCTTKLNDSEIFIVCFSDDALANHDPIFIVYGSLELVSVFFIILTIYVYLKVTDLLDLQGVCILHSISGLAVSFLTLAVNQLGSNHVEKLLCMSMAYVIYFTMMYSFFWLNVLAFHVWRTIVNPKIFRGHKYWSYIYHAFGCGGSIFLLVVLMIAHSMQFSEIHPGFGETKCWFQSTKSQFVYFYGPMAVLLLLNVIYYGWTITILWKHLTHANEKKTKVLKYRLMLCIKLFFIMGISWIFELLSGALQDVDHSVKFIWYVTDGLNTLQGILIFLILVVFRKRVIRGLADRKICGLRLPGRWRALADDECEEIEEELNLSETMHQQKI